MKRGLAFLCGVTLAAGMSASPARADEAGAALAGAVSNYVGTIIQGLAAVADQKTTAETFREQMKPFMEKTPGVFGSSFIDTNFVIRAVYFRRDFLAVGFDLKKVKELDVFWKRMREQPAPQLSEPGHGSLIQPRLVAMRVPVMVDGKMTGIVSVLIHTEAFLKAVGMEGFSAYKFLCLGAPAEQKGDLGAAYGEVSLDLPSTKWVIQFRK